MINKKAVVFGMSGLSLSQSERDFFKSVNPVGFIFFKRNIESIDQFKSLVDDLKNTMGRDDILFLIDQEGGRVQRFRPPLCENFPSALKIGDVYNKNKKDGERLAYLSGALTGNFLSDMGININCAPVLDLYYEGTSEVIGDRAFSSYSGTVLTLSEKYALGMINSGITPVIKHIPGHGRSNLDTHKNIVRVKTSLEEMKNTDFVPFKKFSLPCFGMMSHIIYEAIDSEFPATLSKKVKKAVRDEIGFKGLIFSDDFSMQALTNFEGDFANLAKTALENAVDIVLHCNGDMKEMQKVAETVKNLCNRRKKIIKETMVTASAFDFSDLRKEYGVLYDKYFG